MGQVQRALAIGRDLKPERNLASGLDGVNCHAVRQPVQEAIGKNLSEASSS